MHVGLLIFVILFLLSSLFFILTFWIYYAFSHLTSPFSSLLTYPSTPHIWLHTYLLAPTHLPFLFLSDFIGRILFFVKSAKNHKSCLGYFSPVIHFSQLQVTHVWRRLVVNVRAHQNQCDTGRHRTRWEGHHYSEGLIVYKLTDHKWPFLDG